MAENKIENSGNFTGANVFQHTTVYNAGQIAGTIAKADNASRQQLQALLGQLGETLETIPPDKKDDAEALGVSAEYLMKEASKESPNKSLLHSLGKSLLDMARTVGTAAPTVISIAGSIVDLVGKIHGLT
jgi:hypothetical protein